MDKSVPPGAAILLDLIREMDVGGATAHPMTSFTATTRPSAAAADDHDLWRSGR